jgi:hypothetical protein
MFRRVSLAAAGGLLFTVGSVGAVLAGNPAGTGQPSQSCGSAGAEMAPPGFGTAGFANAESHYANPGSQGGTSSGNAHVVSQYDVACYHYTQSHS